MRAAARAHAYRYNTVILETCRFHLFVWQHTDSTAHAMYEYSLFVLWRPTVNNDVTHMRASQKKWRPAVAGRGNTPSKHLCPTFWLLQRLVTSTGSLSELSSFQCYFVSFPGSIYWGVLGVAFCRIWNFPTVCQVIHCTGRVKVVSEAFSAVWSHAADSW